MLTQDSGFKRAITNISLCLEGSTERSDGNPGRRLGTVQGEYKTGRMRFAPTAGTARNAASVIRPLVVVSAFKLQYV